MLGRPPGRSRRKGAERGIPDAGIRRDPQRIRHHPGDDRPRRPRAGSSRPDRRHDTLGAQPGGNASEHHRLRRAGSFRARRRHDPYRLRHHAARLPGRRRPAALLHRLRDDLRAPPGAARKKRRTRGHEGHDPQYRDVSAGHTADRRAGCPFGHGTAFGRVRRAGATRLPACDPVRLGRNHLRRLRAWPTASTGFSARPAVRFSRGFWASSWQHSPSSSWPTVPARSLRCIGEGG